MENRVPLKIGYLTFFRDRVVIDDNSKLEKILILSSFFASSFYGLWCVLTYSSIIMPIMYYSGILILLTWVAATPFLIKRTYKQVVFYHEIGNINLRQNFEGEFRAKINLKRGKIRLVHLNRNRTHVNSMIDKLREYQLETKNHSIAS